MERKPLRFRMLALPVQTSNSEVGYMYLPARGILISQDRWNAGLRLMTGAGRSVRNGSARASLALTSDTAPTGQPSNSDAN